MQGLISLESGFILSVPRAARNPFDRGISPRLPGA